MVMLPTLEGLFGFLVLGLVEAQGFHDIGQIYEAEEARIGLD